MSTNSTFKSECKETNSSSDTDKSDVSTKQEDSLCGKQIKSESESKIANTEDKNTNGTTTSATPENNKLVTGSSNDAVSAEAEQKTGQGVVEKVSESLKNLWVRGLSEKTRAVDLKTLFSKCGKVLGAKIVTNSKTPYSHFYGFVMMSSSEEATACVERLNHAELHGKILSVEKTMCEIGAAMKRKELQSGEISKKVPAEEKKTESLVSSEKADVNLNVVNEKEKEAEKQLEETETKSKTASAGEEGTDVAVVEESEVRDPNKPDEKGEDGRTLGKEVNERRQHSERSRSRESYLARHHVRERRNMRRSRSRSRERRRRMIEEEEAYRRHRSERYRSDRHRDLRHEERRRYHRDYHHRPSERRDSGRGFDREWEKLKLEEIRLENERLELEREKQRIEHEKLKKEKEELEKQIKERRAAKRPIEIHHEENNLWEERKRVHPDFPPRHEEVLHETEQQRRVREIENRNSRNEDFSGSEIQTLPRKSHPPEVLREEWMPIEMAEDQQQHYKPHISDGRNSPSADEMGWNFERSSPWISPPEDARASEARGQWRPLVPRWEVPPPQPESPYVWLRRPRGPPPPPSYSAPPPMGHPYPVFGAPNRFF